MKVQAGMLIATSANLICMQGKKFLNSNEHVVVCVQVILKFVPCLTQIVIVLLGGSS